MVLLLEQLHAKKTKIKNYSVCLTNDLILACCSQETIARKQRKLFTFFGSDFNKTGIFTSFA